MEPLWSCPLTQNLFSLSLSRSFRRQLGTNVHTWSTYKPMSSCFKAGTNAGWKGWTTYPKSYGISTSWTRSWPTGRGSSPEPILRWVVGTDQWSLRAITSLCHWLHSNQGTELIPAQWGTIWGWTSLCHAGSEQIFFGAARSPRQICQPWMERPPSFPLGALPPNLKSLRKSVKSTWILPTLCQRLNNSVKVLNPSALLNYAWNLIYDCSNCCWFGGLLLPK